MTMYIKFLAVVMAVLSISAHAQAGSIEDRIKAVGDVCMAGEACAAAPVAVASAGAAARSGADVYTTKCALCHATGAAGAPKLGDKAAWTARIGKGIETLYTSSINGFNGMPAKGMCFDCSDDEMKAAVDHMVEGSK